MIKATKPTGITGIQPVTERRIVRVQPWNIRGLSLTPTRFKLTDNRSSLVSRCRGKSDADRTEIRPSPIGRLIRTTVHTQLSPFKKEIFSHAKIAYISIPSKPLNGSTDTPT